MFRFTASGARHRAAAASTVRRVTHTAASEESYGGNALGTADTALLVSSGPHISGVDVDDTSVVVRFTYRADVTLDCKVDTQDASVFSNNFELAADAYWSIGDLNYDGVFTAADASIFSSAWEALSPVLNPPTNVTATPRSGVFYTVDLDWDDVARSGETYSVYASTSAGFTPSDDTLIASGLTASNFAADMLDGSTTYYFAVTTNSAAAVGGGSASSAASGANGGQGVPTPASTTPPAGWNSAYVHTGSEGEAESGVSASWSSEPNPNDPFTGPTTLTLSNVPPNAGISVAFYSSNDQSSSTMTLAVNGEETQTTMEPGTPGASIKLVTGETQESSGTATITLDAGSSQWTLLGLNIGFFVPTVTITPIDTAVEGGATGGSLAGSTAPTGPTAYHAGDSPHNEFFDKNGNVFAVHNSRMIWTSRHDDFDAHLMFIPPGADSRAVPLKHLESGWRGEASYSASTDNWVWMDDPPGTEWNSPAEDTDVYPTWP